MKENIGSKTNFNRNGSSMAVPHVTFSRPLLTRHVHRRLRQPQRSTSQHRLGKLGSPGRTKVAANAAARHGIGLVFRMDRSMTVRGMQSRIEGFVPKTLSVVRRGRGEPLACEGVVAMWFRFCGEGKAAVANQQRAEARI